MLMTPKKSTISMEARTAAASRLWVADSSGDSFEKSIAQPVALPLVPLQIPDACTHSNRSDTPQC
jgi:hypothetical protein